MSPQTAAIIGLVAMFVVATALPINMGAVAFAMAFLVGTVFVGMKAEQIIAGFPGDLFITLVGITYLFAIAQKNGTIDFLVHFAVRGRARAHRRDTLGDVRRCRGIDGRRRGEPRGGGDPRAGRAAVRAAIRHQSADDGTPGDPRRPRWRLLAHQHLRWHHQSGRRALRLAGGRDGAVPGQPDLQLGRLRRAVLRLRRDQAPGASRPGGAGARSRPCAIGADCRSGTRARQPTRRSRRRRPVPLRLDTASRWSRS